MTEKRSTLFLDRGIAHGTVVLNWHGSPEAEFGFFAVAFHDAARKAVEHLRQQRAFGTGGGSDDFRAYPVLFMYRHALELHLKAVILKGATMLRVRGLAGADKDRLRRTHDLDVLRDELERVWIAHGWPWDFGVDHLKSREDLRALIAELAVVDKGSYAFRYPIDTKGKASLASHFRFDLFEFCRVLDGLLEALDGAETASHEETQFALEQQAEAHQFEAENSDPQDSEY